MIRSAKKGRYFLIPEHIEEEFDWLRGSKYSYSKQYPVRTLVSYGLMVYELFSSLQNLHLIKVELEVYSKIRENLVLQSEPETRAESTCLPACSSSVQSQLANRAAKRRSDNAAYFSLSLPRNICSRSKNSLARSSLAPNQRWNTSARHQKKWRCAPAFLRSSPFSGTCSLVAL